MEGWTCPKCGRCYSPFTAQCLVCPPLLTLGGTITVTGTAQCTCGLNTTLVCPVHSPARSYTTCKAGTTPGSEKC